MGEPSRDESAERTSLESWLGIQRRHVLGILEGLDDAQLHRAMLPSAWSFLAMVQHLAFDVEHYWFTCIIGGESLDPFKTGGELSNAWVVGDHVDGQQVLARYREEIQRADLVIASTPLGQAPAQRDSWWGEWEVPDLRFVLSHVTAETACHAGHLDAARELLDNRRWLSLD